MMNVTVPFALIALSVSSNGKSFEQQPLPYAYNALEPHIDAQTMEIHYSRHHAAYTKGFNDALATLPKNYSTTTEVFAEISSLPMVVRNQGGGYYNHTFFWNCLSPKSTQASAKLLDAIKRDFGSMENLQEAFSKAAATQFGSGWAWLVSQNGKLVVCSTPNQDNPLMDVAAVKGTPVLALDVWEHAYYLNYQNRRPDYIKAFWNVANWDFASKQYEQSL